MRELCGEHGALFVHEGGFGKHPSSRGGIVDDQTDGPLPIMAVSGEGFDVDPEAARASVSAASRPGRFSIWTTNSVMDDSAGRATPCPPVGSGGSARPLCPR